MDPEMSDPNAPRSKKKKKKSKNPKWVDSMATKPEHSFKHENMRILLEMPTIQIIVCSGPSLLPHGIFISWINELQSFTKWGAEHTKQRGPGPRWVPADSWDPSSGWRPEAWFVQLWNSVVSSCCSLWDFQRGFCWTFRKAGKLCWIELQDWELRRKLRSVSDWAVGAWHFDLGLRSGSS